MRSLRYAAVIAICLAFGTAAWGQSATRSLLVSTGGTTGTYYKLVNEMKEACPEANIEQWLNGDKKPSSGALENIDNILNNKAELGVVQHDALELRSRKEEDVKKRIFTLMTLHPEEVHLIARAAPLREGGYLGTNVGAKDVVLRTAADLKGRKIGYWGGSSVTVQVMQAFTLVGWEPVDTDNQGEATTMLKDGRIDAILAVGGQPLSWVASLSRDFKLLEIPDQMVRQLDAVYNKSSVSYRNLGQDGVQTVSVDALLVTRNYTAPAAIKRLAGLRQCVIDKIDEIRDTRDTHPKWQVIDPAKESRWQMFKPAINSGTNANRG